QAHAAIFAVAPTHQRGGSSRAGGNDFPKRAERTHALAESGDGQRRRRGIAHDDRSLHRARGGQPQASAVERVFPDAFGVAGFHRRQESSVAQGGSCRVTTLMKFSEKFKFGATSNK